MTRVYNLRRKKEGVRNTAYLRGGANRCRSGFMSRSVLERGKMPEVVVRTELIKLREAQEL